MNDLFLKSPQEIAKIILHAFPNSFPKVLCDDLWIKIITYNIQYGDYPETYVMFNNNIIGTYYEYYTNDKLWCEENYDLQGRRHGQWKEWDRRGQLIKNITITMINFMVNTNYIYKECIKLKNMIMI